MMSAPLPPDESDRLQSLGALGLLLQITQLTIDLHVGPIRDP